MTPPAEGRRPAGKARRRFGDIFDSLSRSLSVLPEAPELAEELRRLSEEIHALSPSQPFVEGFERAYRVTDGAHYGGAPLVSLAAEMIADHAPDSGWSRDQLVAYLEGLGPARAAEFLEELAAATRS